MKKDIVVGAITNYTFDKIKPWVESLDRSGFDGVKALLCYNVDYDTVDELVKRNYTIFTFARNDEIRKFTYRNDFSIVVERFFHLWYFLKGFKDEYRYLIATDVKDVIFQKNPSVWLEQNIGDKSINASSESIRYCDEPWGNNNLKKSFGPVIHDNFKSNVINNCGVLSGEFNTMIDLFLNIYMLCNGTNHLIEGGGGPDQAALNILLNLEPYKLVTRYTLSEEAWSAQLGTTGPQVRSLSNDSILEPCPVRIDDMICTSKGEPFTIVHQYDRVPEWKQFIEKKYA